MTFDYSKYTTSGFVKFPNVGDQIVGIIKHVREGKDYDGNPCPEWILEVNDQGDEVTLNITQVKLLALAAEKRPKEGDKIRIVYTGDSTSSRAGRAPAKEFTLDVQPGPHALASPGPADEAPF